MSEPPREFDHVVDLVAERQRDEPGDLVFRLGEEDPRWILLDHASERMFVLPPGAVSLVVTGAHKGASAITPDGPAFVPLDQPSVQDFEGLKNLCTDRNEFWGSTVLFFPTITIAPAPPSVALTRANRVFSILEALVPTRISNEELGDALETMTGRGAAWILVKTISTVFWVGVNALRDVSAALLGRAVSGRG